MIDVIFLHPYNSKAVTSERQQHNGQQTVVRPLTIETKYPPLLLQQAVR